MAGRPLLYPWDRLKLKGKSHFIPKSYAQIAPTVRAYERRHPPKLFRVQTVKGGVQVRRIK